MFIPIGDRPNPPGVAVVNWTLILANIGVFVFISLPLMGQRIDTSDPATQELLRRLLEQHPDQPRFTFLRHIVGQLTAYDVFLAQWGFRPAAPSLQTLFSSMFLHASWLHLVGNLLFLWIYGDNVEARLGRGGYLVAYLATGVAATVGYSMVAPDNAGHVPMVGASGAISGVLGFYFLWFPQNRVKLLVLLFPFFVGVWHVRARIVLGFYLIVDNLLPFLLDSDMRSGVAYGAHIGGFIAGLILAMIFWGRGQRPMAGDSPYGPPGYQ